MDESEITVQFEVDGLPVSPIEVEDEFLAEMLEHTAEQIYRDVAHKLSGVRCPQHNKPAIVTVVGTYDTTAEQMELSYHIDSCCQIGLMRTVSALNH